MAREPCERWRVAVAGVAARERRAASYLWIQKVFVSVFGSVTASFGHYDVSGTTYVVPDLHAKIGHVDPELSC